MNNHSWRKKAYAGRIIGLILTGALCLQLAACGASTAESSAEPTFGEPTKISTPTPTPTATSTPIPTSTPTPEPTPEVKPEMDGFDESTNIQVQIGNMIFSVPNYFSEKDTDNEETAKVFRCSEGNNTGALLFFIYGEDSEKEFSGDEFDGSDEVNQEIAEIFGCEDISVTESSAITLASLDGYKFTFDAVDSDSDGESIKGYCAYTYQSDKNSLYIALLMEVGETEYSYSSDFDKIVDCAAYSVADVDKSEESNAASDDTDISPEFKATMDSYEEFFDDYIEFMDKYEANPTDLTLLTEYLDWLNKYADYMDKMEALEDEDLTDAELIYYLEVTARIEQKLLGTYSEENAPENDSAEAKDEEPAADADTDAAAEKTSSTSSVEIGDEITLGSYEQNNVVADGMEDIEWIVIAVEDNRALVVSKYALDCQPYCNPYKSVTWESCSLRTWLNDTFYNKAFDDEEQKRIQSTTITADANPKYSTDPGTDTTDQIFLLSVSEVENYCSSDVASCKITAYAEANGGFCNSSDKCWWWLRTPGDITGDAVSVNTDGTIDYDGDDINHIDVCVRPAMWISIE